MTIEKATDVEFSVAEVDAALHRGSVTFFGLELYVAPGALVPRPETEILARASVEKVSAVAISGEPWVIDVCCGAGNLGCAVAAHVPEARVWCADLTDACVAVARTNVARNGLDDRVSVLQGDLFAPLAAAGLAGRIDVVVCNPPYISTGRLGKDRAELLDREPREAFDGGPYGASIHQRVVRDAPALLKRGGWLLMEFGIGQERQIEGLLARAKSYAEIRFVTDVHGRPRVVVARHDG